MMCEIYLKPDLASWGYNVFEASEGGVNGKDFCFPLFFFLNAEKLSLDGFGFHLLLFYLEINFFFANLFFPTSLQLSM